MQEIHVVGAAIIDGSRVLAAQRSAGMSMPLKWEFPGGKVECGETHQEALYRELYEELGIKVQADSFVATGTFELDEKKIVLHVYEAKIFDGIPVLKEHNAICWVEISQMDKLDWADADIPAYKELMKSFNKSYIK